MTGLIILGLAFFSVGLFMVHLFSTAMSDKSEENQLFDTCNCDPYFLSKGFHSDPNCKILHKNRNKT